jgi:hypothetical protein
MSPTGYGSVVEMNESGMSWTTAPTGGDISFWTSSTTSGITNVFAQIGILYNGLSVAVCVGDCSTSTPANSWGVFYEFFPGGSDHGDDYGPPSGWNAGDNIAVTMRTFGVNGNEIAFYWTDVTDSGAIKSEFDCSDGYVVGDFSGTIGGIDESGDANLVPHDIHVSGTSLWSEVVGTGRNYGSGSSSVAQSPPSTDLINMVSNNDFTFGFQNSGTHYSSSGTSIYSGSGSGSNEYLPSDGCGT